MEKINLAEMQRTVHETALEKGWWEKSRTNLEDGTLWISELYEGFEVYRKFGTFWAEEVEPGKYEGFCVELADLIIRIMDSLAYNDYHIVDKDNYSEMIVGTNTTEPVEFINWCERFIQKYYIEEDDLRAAEYLIYQVFRFCRRIQMNLPLFLKLKVEYNKTRSYRHGNKTL